MENSPIVSIVLPVYNIGECLSETLDSVTNQTYANLEIICIDDGSTDDSLQTLRAYAEKDARFSVHTQENAGQGAARNAGLDRATGEYVMLLDADDIYDAQFVEKMVTRAEGTQADIVICRTGEIDHTSGRTRSCLWTAEIQQIPTRDPFSVQDMYDFIFTAFVGWPWDKLFRRSFLEEYELRFPDLENSEDLYFVFLALVRARRISFLDEQLILHRVGRSGSVSNSRVKAPLAFYDGVCLLKEQLKRNPEEYAKLSWGFLNWAFDYAIWNIESMDDIATRRYIVNEILAGHLPELEIFEHSKPFFSLEYSDRRRFIRLCDEAVEHGMDDATAERHPRMYYLVTVLDEVRVHGYRKTFKKVLSKLKSRTDDPTHAKLRGYDYYQAESDEGQD